MTNYNLKQKNPFHDVCDYPWNPSTNKTLPILLNCWLWGQSIVHQYCQYRLNMWWLLLWPLCKLLRLSFFPITVTLSCCQVLAIQQPWWFIKAIDQQTNNLYDDINSFNGQLFNSMALMMTVLQLVVSVAVMMN